MAGTWVEVLASSKLGQPNGVAQLDASQKLSSAQIPSVPVTKLTGVLSDSQIPSLSASKITSGTFSSSRIPSLDASKVTTGTLGSDRIPTLAQSKISGLGTALASKVSNTTTVNGHALSGNVTVTKGDVGLSSVENKSSATIRSEISKANITNTGVNTSDLIKGVTELPASGADGEMVKFNDAIYVWKTTT
jgi:hypothetical protein